MTMTNTFSEICAVQLPEQTQSYTPVPNGRLVKTLRSMLDDAGIEITTERFELGHQDQQMFGVMQIRPSGVAENKTTTRALGFRNSYDKSLPVGFVTGTNVIVCSNLMFQGEIKLLRKHTTNVFGDLERLIAEAIGSVEQNYQTIEEDIERLRATEVDRLLAAELCGEMFMVEGIINTTQLNIIKRHWDAQKRDVQTGWDLMNHCTEAMKACVPYWRMRRQLELSQFFDKRLLAK
jgi:hypothetical protein